MHKNKQNVYDCKRSIPDSHFSCKTGKVVRTKKKKCLREDPIYNRIKHHFTTCGLCNLLTCGLNYMFNPFFYLLLEFCDFCVGCFYCLNWPEKIKQMTRQSIVERLQPTVKFDHISPTFIKNKRPRPWRHTFKS